MSTTTNAISELRALADAGELALVEREVLCDLNGLAGDEPVYVSFSDVAAIRGILRKLDKVPAISRLALTVETPQFGGKPYVLVRDGEGDNAETYASGNVDYVAGFMDAMRVAFTRVARVWYAQGLA